MPLEIGWQEHFDNVQQGVNDYVTESIENARQFYCNLYEDSPQWVIRRNPYVSPLVRKGLERMCPGQNPPPPPEPLPFLGGQCCDTTYDVSYRIYVTQCLNYAVLQEFTAVARITGKILGGKVGAIPSNPAFSGAYIEYENCAGTVLDQPLWSTTVGATTGACLTSDPTNPVAPNVAIDQSFVEILGITVVAGSDDCGDPPGGYPPLPPPTDDDLRDYYNITYNDNSIRTVIYNINRDPSGNIFFPPVINVGDVAINFDIGGICVGCVGTKNYSGGGGGGGSPVVTDDDMAEEETEEEVMEEEEDGDEEDVFRIKAVRVDVTTVPSNNRSQSGSGSPNILFVGWLEFKIGNAYVPREPMDFRNNYFIAPDGATGYAYCLKKGFRATITVIKEKVEPTG